MTMGDRICVMKDGAIQQVAAPLELYNAPANLYVAGFIGSPPMNLLRGRIARRDGQLSFVETSASPESGDGTGDGLKAPSSPPPPLSLALTGSFAQRAAPLTDRPCVLGVRPENIMETARGGSVAVAARVELVEPMGAETYVHARTAAHTLTARLSPSGAHETGRAVTLHFDLEKAHLFDASNERAVL
jgi:multiple sugar transport system ATP-binding protein